MQLIYSNKRSPNASRLEKDNSVSIHNKNIQALTVEMFKVKHTLFSEITCDIFIEKTNNDTDITSPQVNIVYHGTKSIVLEEIKQKNSLNNFKESIKLWALISCPCRFCKVFF